MAITTTNLSYSGQGPSASGQVYAQGPETGAYSSNIDAVAQITLDGVATTATLGFIDGVQTLSFTPRAVLVARTNQSTDTAAAGTTVSVTGPVTNVGIPITISAAGANAQLLSVAVRIIR